MSGGRVFLDGRLTDDSESIDLLLREGKIAEIGSGLAQRFPDIRQLDVAGQIVLPGGIDPHVHLAPPWIDDYESGSRCALAGGITTVGQMLFPEPSQTIPQAIVAESRRIASTAQVDVFFHPVVRAPRFLSAEELDWLKAEGHTSIKVFLFDRQFDPYADAWKAFLKQVARRQLIVAVHCEDWATIAEAIRSLKQKHATPIDRFADSRSILSEVIAVRRAIELCRKTEATFYIVHLSSAQALAECRHAKSEGLPLFVETRPLYLHLSEQVYATARRRDYLAMPPIRTLADQAALWQGLIDGAIDTVGSDHAAWTRKQKHDPNLTLDNSRPGINNLQFMLPMLYSEGVNSGRMTLQRFVEVSSTNAATIFGLAPRKGTIAVGADADLAIWDPDIERVISDQDVLSNAGFTVYAGRTVRGWPTTTIRRGRQL